MKKFLFIAFAALALSACSGKLSKEDAKKEYIEFIEEATDKIKGVSSVEEIDKIGEELKTKGEALDEKMDEDVKKELREDAEVLQAMQNMMEVSFQKGMELAQ